MIDFAITFLAFFLTFHLTTTLLRVFARNEMVANYFSGSRGLYLVFLPVFIAFGVATLSIFPHIFGTVSGESHITNINHSDQQEPVPFWLIGLLIVIGLRYCLRLISEMKIDLHLHKVRVQPNQSLLSMVSNALKLTDKGSQPRIHFHNSDRYYEPFIRGVFLPTIYLHADLVRSLSTDHLGAALFHELGHKRRGDHLIMAFYSFFLSPIGLVYIMRRGFDEWIEASERKCDAIASHRVGSSRTVAKALVAVVKFASERHAPKSCLSLCGHRTIKERIAKLISSEIDDNIEPIETQNLLRSGVFITGSSLLFSLIAPHYGLELYCFFEQIVGTHCVG